MQCKRFIFCLLVIGVFPCFAEASQIAPNPNPAGSTIDIINDPTAFNNANPFNNGGIINIDSSSTLTNTVGAELDNYASPLFNGSTLNNAGTFNNYGRLCNCEGGTLTNALGGTINNYGSLFNSIQSTLTNAGTLNNYAGGLVDFGSAILTHTTNTGTINNFTGARLDFGEWGPLNAVGGTINNYGTMTNALNNAGTLNNFGSWFNTNNFGGTNSIGAALNNQGSMSLIGPWSNNGTFINAGSAEWTPGGLGNSGTLINTGSMTGSSYTLSNTGGTLVNTGTIDRVIFSQTGGLTINNGTMTISPFASSFNIQGGTLMGTGTINALVVIASGATLAPGTPTTVGTFTINGNLQSSGNYLFRIAEVSGQFDVLKINGNAAFTGGTMAFSFLNFTPHIGDSWDFLYASAISGWDSLSFIFSGLSSNETAQFHFHDGIETLRIVAMPEPSSSLLFGLGLVGLALWRKVKAV
jgi:hypothetical protein